MITKQTTSHYVAAKESNPDQRKRTFHPFPKRFAGSCSIAFPSAGPMTSSSSGYRAREVVPGFPFAIERLARLNPYAVAFRCGEPSADLLEPEEAEEIVASVTVWADACILLVAERADGPC